MNCLAMGGMIASLALSARTMLMVEPATTPFASTVWAEALTPSLSKSMRTGDLGNDGETKYGTVVGGIGLTGVNTTFDSIERIIGSDGDDSFTVNGFEGTEDSNTRNGFVSVMAVVGGDGTDTFADLGNSLLIDYRQEQFIHDSDHGVAVNLSTLGKVAVGFDEDRVRRRHNSDRRGNNTFGKSDSISGVIYYDLTDEKDYFWAGADGVDVNGNDGDDAFVGGAGRDSFDGGNGADTADGGDNSDELEGGNGGDTLSRGAGRDRLSGENDVDFLDGGDGADELSGGNDGGNLPGRGPSERRDRGR